MIVTSDIYAEYLRGLLSGSREPCRQIVATMLSQGLSIPDLYTQLFQKSLYDVGALWEQHKISVAVEHMATALTESLMALAYPALFDRLPSDQSAIVSCTANEYHQIGGRMVADIFEMHGWNGHFLGANTPISDLLELVHEKHPKLIALSVSVYFSMPGLLRTIEAIRGAFPSIPILVGGQAFRWGGATHLEGLGNVTYLPDLDALDKILIKGL